MLERPALFWWLEPNDGRPILYSDTRDGMGLTLVFLLIIEDSFGGHKNRSVIENEGASKGVANRIWNWLLCYYKMTTKSDLEAKMRRTATFSFMSVDPIAKSSALHSGIEVILGRHVPRIKFLTFRCIEPGATVPKMSHYKTCEEWSKQASKHNFGQL